MQLVLQKVHGASFGIMNINFSDNAILGMQKCMNILLYSIIFLSQMNHRFILRLLINCRYLSSITLSEQNVVKTKLNIFLTHIFKLL